MRAPKSLATRAGAVILAGTMMLAGCADTSKDEGDKDDAAKKEQQQEIYVNGFVGDGANDGGDAKDGGTLTVGEYAEARSLDPTKTIPNGAVGGNALAAIYDTLLRYDSESKTIEPQLAESMTSDDDTVWTLKLRDGVTFSDGTPLNSAAVLGSLGYYMKNAGFNTQLLASGIKDMKPKGDLEVEFTLQRPWATFPVLLAGGPGMVMAPAAYKNPANFKPVGAGPFVFKDYKPAEELVLTKNEKYFDGAPHLDSLRFVFLASDPARLDSLKAGEIDTAYLRGPQVVETARSEDYNGFMEVVGGGSTLMVNSAKGHPGEDVRVRQALSYALDRKLWMQRTNGDHGLPNGALVPALWDYGVDTDEHYDPEKAKQLLDEAKADGYDGKISYLGQSDQQSQAAAVVVKAMLEKVGFTVETDLLRNVTDQTTRVYVERDFDLATSALSMTQEDPYGRLSTMFSSTSPANAAGYSNPEMDKLIGELEAADADQQKDILGQINTLWLDNVPMIALADGAVFYPWGDNVHGLQPTAEQMLLFDEAWKD